MTEEHSHACATVRKGVRESCCSIVDILSMRVVSVSADQGSLHRLQICGYFFQVLDSLKYKSEA